MAGGIDWPALMRAALAPRPAGLGLRPQDFWRLTPVELRLMLGRAAAAVPLTRARLAELAAAFPDRKGGEDERDRDVRGPVGCAGGTAGPDGGDGRDA